MKKPSKYKFNKDYASGPRELTESELALCASDPGTRQTARRTMFQYAFAKAPSFETLESGVGKRIMRKVRRDIARKIAGVWRMRHAI